MIMNPRAIPECVSALEAIPSDKAWLTGYTEAQLVPIINGIIEEHADTYDAIGLVSDDAIVSLDAWHDVEASILFGYRDRVYTGWCNLDSVSDLCTLNPVPLRYTKNALPKLESYSLMRMGDIQPHDDLEQMRTYFHGYALTYMTPELWKRYPYNVCTPPSRGCASDWHQCVRLQADDVPIMAVLSAQLDHVKEVANQTDQAPSKRCLIGKVTPQVRWEYHS